MLALQQVWLEVVSRALPMCILAPEVLYTSPLACFPNASNSAHAPSFVARTLVVGVPANVLATARAIDLHHSCATLRHAYVLARKLRRAPICRPCIASIPLCAERVPGPKSGEGSLSPCATRDNPQWCPSDRSTLALEIDAAKTSKQAP